MCKRGTKPRGQTDIIIIIIIKSTCKYMLEHVNIKIFSLTYLSMASFSIVTSDTPPSTHGHLYDDKAPPPTT